MENEQDGVIVNNEEDTNEEVTETTEEQTAKAEKPKRTPQEEYDYHTGKAKRLAKKLGLEGSTKAEETTQPKPSDLDYGQLALLRTEGIKGSGELALFKEVMAETGKGVLDVMDSNYFKSRLADFREAQASADAIPKGKNRSGQTGITDTDLAVAKYKESGNLPDDFKTRLAVVKKISEEEKSLGVFSGPSVIGPQGQQF